MIEKFLAKGFQLSFGRPENWTHVYYFINEPLNTEKDDVYKSTLVPRDFAYYIVLHQVEDLQQFKNETKHSDFVVVFHKSLLLLHHTFLFVHLY